MTAPKRTLADLGAVVRRARQARGWGRRLASKQPGSPASPTTWENVEKGLVVQDLTFAGIETVFGWPRGSMQAYLDGGDEPPIDPPRGFAEVPDPTVGTSYAVPVAIGGDDDGPALNQATYDQLLVELRRRHDAMRDELARRLRPVLDEPGTPEEVEARGKILGRRVQGDDAGDEGDAAGGR